MTTTFCTIGGVMVAENRGGVYTEYVPDPLGSLIQCKNASGTVTYEAEYYPYGEVEKQTGSKQNDWGFVGCLGHLRDTAARLYVRARYYQVQLGRWLTVDPLWPEESAYGYGAGVPSALVDATGTSILMGLASYCLCCGKAQSVSAVRGAQAFCGKYDFWITILKQYM